LNKKLDRYDVVSYFTSGDITRLALMCVIKVYY